MSSKTSWKEALLSSGVPLEGTVARMLTAIGCVVLGEREFTVIDSGGTQVRRSVDLLGMWSLPALNLQLLVECKYRRDGVQWFFLRDPQKVLGQRDWFTNCFVSPFVPPWYSDTNVVIPPVVTFGYHPTLDQHTLPIGIKGVQIVPGGESNRGKYKSSDETPIKNASYQLRYAATAHQFGFPPIPKDHFSQWAASDHFSFTLPILVTTAKLYLLQKKSGVPEIRTAEKPEDVADEVPALILHTEPSADLRRYSRLLLAENYAQLIENASTAKMAELWKERVFNRPGPNQSSFAELQSLAVPKDVIVLNLDALEQTLSSWAQRLGISGLLEALDPSIASIGGMVYDVNGRLERYREDARASDGGAVAE